MLILTGCARVYIRHTDGRIDVSNHIGVVNINILPGNHSTFINTEMIGLSSAFDKIVIGYLDESITLPGNDCRIILYEPNRLEIKNLFEMLNGEDSICIIEKDRREE